MDTYYKTEDQPLEPNELRKLKRGFWVIPIFLVLFGGFFAFLFNMLNPNEGITFWIPVGFMTFFIGIMGYIIWGFIMDMSEKTKQVFQGLITRKHHRRSTGKSKNSSYFLYFGEKKRMRVEPHIYHKFEEGDLIEIHRSRRLYNMIYKTELLKRDVMTQAVSEVKKAQMSKQQRAAFILISLFVVIVGSLVGGVLLGVIEW